MRKAALCLSLVGIFLLVGCASQQTRYVVSESSFTRTTLIPHGTYRHRIAVVQKNKERRTFLGVIHLNGKKVEMVGLSPVHTTLFRIIEDRSSGSVKVYIYHQALRKYGSQLKEIYLALGSLLKRELTTGEKVALSQRDEQGLPKVIEAKAFDKMVTINLADFDKQLIPLWMEIVHPEFSVGVEVVGYEI